MEAQLKIWSHKLQGVLNMLSPFIMENEPVDIELSEGGLKVQYMDQGHVAMISITMPPQAFEEYDVKETLHISPQYDKLHKIVGFTGKDGKITITRVEGGITVRAVGSHIASYKINMMEITNTNEKKAVPELSWKSSISMKAGDLLDILKNLKIISKKLVVSTNDGGVVFGSEEFGETGNILLNKDEPIVERIEVDGNSKSVFSLEMLETLLKFDKKSIVTLYFGDGLPLKLISVLDDEGSTMVGYLAPRRDEV